LLSPTPLIPIPFDKPFLQPLTHVYSHSFTSGGEDARFFSDDEIVFRSGNGLVFLSVSQREQTFLKFEPGISLDAFAVCTKYKIVVAAVHGPNKCEVRLYRHPTHDPALLYSIPHTSIFPLTHVCVSQCGTQIAAVGSAFDRNLYIWDATCLNLQKNVLVETKPRGSTAGLATPVEGNLGMAPAKALLESSPPPAPLQIPLSRDVDVESMSFNPRDPRELITVCPQYIRAWIRTGELGQSGAEFGEGPGTTDTTTGGKSGNSGTSSSSSSGDGSAPSSGASTSGANPSGYMSPALDPIIRRVFSIEHHAAFTFHSAAVRATADNIQATKWSLRTRSSVNGSVGNGKGMKTSKFARAKLSATGSIVYKTTEQPNGESLRSTAAPIPPSVDSSYESVDRERKIVAYTWFPLLTHAVLVGTQKGELILVCLDRIRRPNVSSRPSFVANAAAAATAAALAATQPTVLTTSQAQSETPGESQPPTTELSTSRGKTVVPTLESLQAIAKDSSSIMESILPATTTSPAPQPVVAVLIQTLVSSTSHGASHGTGLPITALVSGPCHLLTGHSDGSVSWIDYAHIYTCFTSTIFSHHLLSPEDRTPLSAGQLAQLVTAFSQSIAASVNEAAFNLANSQQNSVPALLPPLPADPNTADPFRSTSPTHRNVFSPESLKNSDVLLSLLPSANAAKVPYVKRIGVAPISRLIFTPNFRVFASVDTVGTLTIASYSLAPLGGVSDTNATAISESHSSEGVDVTLDPNAHQEGEQGHQHQHSHGHSHLRDISAAMSFYNLLYTVQHTMFGTPLVRSLHNIRVHSFVLANLLQVGLPISLARLQTFLPGSSTARLLIALRRASWAYGMGVVPIPKACVVLGSYPLLAVLKIGPTASGLVSTATSHGARGGTSAVSNSTSTQAHTSFSAANMISPFASKPEPQLVLLHTRAKTVISTFTFPVLDTTLCLSASADGHMLAIGFQSGSVRILDVSDPALPRCIFSERVHHGPVSAIAFSPAAPYLAVLCSQTGELVLLRYATMKMSKVSGALVPVDGGPLETDDPDEVVNLSDTTTDGAGNSAGSSENADPEVVEAQRNREAGVGLGLSIEFDLVGTTPVLAQSTCMAWIPIAQSHRLFIGNALGYALILNAPTTRYVVNEHTGQVRHRLPAPPSLFREGTHRLSGRVLSPIIADLKVAPLAFAPDPTSSRGFFTFSADKLVKRFTLEDVNDAGLLDVPPAVATQTYSMPIESSEAPLSLIDGLVLGGPAVTGASNDQEGSISGPPSTAIVCREIGALWEDESGGHLKPGSALVISPNGELTASGGRDGLIIIRRVRDPLFRIAISAHDPSNGGVQSLAFSSNSATLFSTGRDGAVLAWNVAGALPPAASRAPLPSLVPIAVYLSRAGASGLHTEGRTPGRKKASKKGLLGVDDMDDDRYSISGEHREYASDDENDDQQSEVSFDQVLMARQTGGTSKALGTGQYSVAAALTLWTRPPQDEFESIVRLVFASPPALQASPAVTDMLSCLAPTYGLASNAHGHISDIPVTDTHPDIIKVSGSPEPGDITNMCFKSQTEADSALFSMSSLMSNVEFCLTDPALASLQKKGQGAASAPGTSSIPENESATGSLLSRLVPPPVTEKSPRYPSIRVRHVRKTSQKTSLKSPTPKVDFELDTQNGIKGKPRLPTEVMYGDMTGESVWKQWLDIRSRLEALIAENEAADPAARLPLSELVVDTEALENAERQVGEVVRATRLAILKQNLGRNLVQWRIIKQMWEGMQAHGATLYPVAPNLARATIASRLSGGANSGDGATDPSEVGSDEVNANIDELAVEAAAAESAGDDSHAWTLRAREFGLIRQDKDWGLLALRTPQEYEAYDASIRAAIELRDRPSVLYKPIGLNPKPLVVYDSDGEMCNNNVVPLFPAKFNEQIKSPSTEPNSDPATTTTRQPFFNSLEDPAAPDSLRVPVSDRIRNAKMTRELRVKRVMFLTRMEGLDRLYYRSQKYARSTSIMTTSASQFEDAPTEASNENQSGAKPMPFDRVKATSGATCMLLDGTANPLQIEQPLPSSGVTLGPLASTALQHASLWMAVHGGSSSAQQPSNDPAASLLLTEAQADGTGDAASQTPGTLAVAGSAASTQPPTGASAAAANAAAVAAFEASIPNLSQFGGEGDSSLDTLAQARQITAMENTLERVLYNGGEACLRHIILPATTWCTRSRKVAMLVLLQEVIRLRKEQFNANLRNTILLKQETIEMLRQKLLRTLEVQRDLREHREREALAQLAITSQTAQPSATAVTHGGGSASRTGGVLTLEETYLGTNELTQSAITAQQSSGLVTAGANLVDTGVTQGASSFNSGNSSLSANTTFATAGGGSGTQSQIATSHPLVTALQSSLSGLQAVLSLPAISPEIFSLVSPERPDEHLLQVRDREVIEAVALAASNSPEIQERIRRARNASKAGTLSNKNPQEQLERGLKEMMPYAVMNGRRGLRVGAGGAPGGATSSLFIVRPEWMISTPPETWTDEQRAQAMDIERKERLLKAERDAKARQLEADLKRNRQEIIDICYAFDTKVLGLARERRLLNRSLQRLELVALCLARDCEESLHWEKARSQLNDVVKKLARERSRRTILANAMRKELSSCQKRIDSLLQEDRVRDRTVKRELSELIHSASSTQSQSPQVLPFAEVLFKLYRSGPTSQHQTKFSAVSLAGRAAQQSISKRGLPSDNSPADAGRATAASTLPDSDISLPSARGQETALDDEKHRGGSGSGRRSRSPSRDGTWMGQSSAPTPSPTMGDTEEAGTEGSTQFSFDPFAQSSPELHPFMSAVLSVHTFANLLASAATSASASSSATSSAASLTQITHDPLNGGDSQGAASSSVNVSASTAAAAVLADAHSYAIDIPDLQFVKTLTGASSSIAAATAVARGVTSSASHTNQTTSNTGQTQTTGSTRPRRIGYGNQVESSVSKDTAHGGGANIGSSASGLTSQTQMMSFVTSSLQSTGRSLLASSDGQLLNPEEPLTPELAWPAPNGSPLATLLADFTVSAPPLAAKGATGQASTGSASGSTPTSIWQYLCARREEKVCRLRALAIELSQVALLQRQQLDAEKRLAQLAALQKSAEPALLAATKAKAKLALDASIVLILRQGIVETDTSDTAIVPDLGGAKVIAADRVNNINHSILEGAAQCEDLLNVISKLRAKLAAENWTRKLKTLELQEARAIKQEVHLLRITKALQELIKSNNQSNSGAGSASNRGSSTSTNAGPSATDTTTPLERKLRHYQDVADEEKAVRSHALARLKRRTQQMQEENDRLEKAVNRLEQLVAERAQLLSVRSGPGTADHRKLLAATNELLGSSHELPGARPLEDPKIKRLQEIARRGKVVAYIAEQHLQIAQLKHEREELRQKIFPSFVLPALPDLSEAQSASPPSIPSPHRGQPSATAVAASAAAAGHPKEGAPILIHSASARNGLLAVPPPPKPVPRALLTSLQPTRSLASLHLTSQPTTLTSSKSVHSLLLRPSKTGQTQPGAADSSLALPKSSSAIDLMISAQSQTARPLHVPGQTSTISPSLSTSGLNLKAEPTSTGYSAGAGAEVKASGPHELVSSSAADSPEELPAPTTTLRSLSHSSSTPALPSITTLKGSQRLSQAQQPHQQRSSGQKPMMGLPSRKLSSGQLQTSSSTANLQLIGTSSLHSK